MFPPPNSAQHTGIRAAPSSCLAGSAAPPRDATGRGGDRLYGQWPRLFDLYFPAIAQSHCPKVGRAIGRGHDPSMMTLPWLHAVPCRAALAPPSGGEIFFGGCVAQQMRLTRMKCRPCSIITE